MTQIAFNPFVRRQTASSPYTHWELSDSVVIDRAIRAMNDGLAQPGYRDGVLVVPIQPDGFYTALTVLEDGDELVGTFKGRREGEDPRKQTWKLADETWTKPEAKAVNVILYASSTLEEDGSNTLDPVEGNWEIVSINGCPTPEQSPIDPITLMHNHFHVPGSNDGGTSTNMSDEEFVSQLRESFHYWKDKAFLQA